MTGGSSGSISEFALGRYFPLLKTGYSSKDTSSAKQLHIHICAYWRRVLWCEVELHYIHSTCCPEFVSSLEGYPL